VSTVDVRLPDGTIIRGVPEGTTKEQLRAKLAANGYDVSKLGDPPPAERSTAQVLGRALGSTARAALEGVPAIADLAWNPVRQIAVNPALRAAGMPPLGSMEDSGRALADLLGLPTPDTPMERVGFEGAKLGFGAGGIAGASQGLANVSQGVGRTLAEKMAQAPASQVLAGVGAGAAGQSAKESGADPTGQFLAALAGGLGGALAPGAAQGVVQALARLKPMDVAQVDTVLARELARSGINWQALSEQARAQLRQDASRFVVRGQELDPKALARLAQFRAVPGTTPLLGDVTQNPALISQQRNLAKQQANMPALFGAEDLATVQNRNAAAVLGELDRVAPAAGDDFSTAQGIIGAIQGRDARMKGAVDSLYDAARDSAGGRVPLSPGAALEGVFRKLDDEWLTSELPESIADKLAKMARGEMPTDVASLEILRRRVNEELRSASGNKRAALAVLSRELDNVPIVPIKTDFGGSQVVTSGTAAMMRNADDAAGQTQSILQDARRSNREWRSWQESARFIEDAINDPDPLNFAKKHIIGGRLDDLQRMRTEIGNSPEMLQQVRRRMVEYILRRGSADMDKTTFTSKGMEDGLRSLTRQRLEVFFSPEEIQQIEMAIAVGRNIQAQPIGSAVNNSNTGAMIAARLLSLVSSGQGLPVAGPMIFDPLQKMMMMSQASRLRDVGQGIGLLGELERQSPLLPATLGTGALLLSSQ
jgi:hypothetical protein